MTTNPQPQPTFRMTASAACTYDYETHTHDVDWTAPQAVEISAVFGTTEDAAAWVATQPKALGLHATTLHRPVDGNYRNGNEKVGFIRGRAVLAKNGANGGKNETGIKRAVRWIRDLDITFGDEEHPAVNAYPTLAAFLTAVGAKVEA